MRIRPSASDALWMAVGATILSVFILLVLFFGEPSKPDARLAFKAQRVDLVGRMQLGLASASEAEKSAVLAITDEESQSFAEQARASMAVVERERQELDALLRQGGTPDEKDLLAEFSRRFIEFQQIDAEVLGLAVKNTNLKAYALTFGPAASALDEMSAALTRVLTANADAANAKKVMSHAFGAEIGALRIQSLLPSHIAEATDPRMDEMEARMSEEDEQVRSNLEGLGALPKLSDAADVAVAASRYARFREIKSQAIALSRENTNVRSLSISLNQKRKVMLTCHEVLANLEEAILKEPSAGMTLGERFGAR